MIKWLHNDIVRRTSDYDVSIRKGKMGPNMFVINMAFGGAFAARIRDKRYVDIGVDGNRVYFKISDVQSPGMRKTTDYSSDGYSIQYVVQTIVNELLDFTGMYSVKAATEEDDLYYLEKGEE